MNQEPNTEAAEPAQTTDTPAVDLPRLVRLYCYCCGKQAVKNGKPPRHDKYTTTLEGARAGFNSDEVFCGYCAEEMDENGLFPEEQVQAYGY